MRSLSETENSVDETQSPTTDLIQLKTLADLGVDVEGDAGKKAARWITFVSNYLRVIARNNGIDLDRKLKDDEVGGDGSYRSVVEMVVANAVVRANAKPTSIPDAVSYSLGANPYSESVNYGSNATQDAYFKNKELQLLGFRNLSGKKQIGLIRGLRG